MKRQRHHERTSDQPDKVGRCCQRQHNTARKLSIRERLDDKATKQVDDAVEVSTTLPTSSSSSIYQTFLYDFLRHCGTGLVLLCAASLGEKRIVVLSLKERVSPRQYVHRIVCILRRLIFNRSTNLTWNGSIPKMYKACRFHSRYLSSRSHRMHHKVTPFYLKEWSLWLKHFMLVIKTRSVRDPSASVSPKTILDLLPRPSVIRLTAPPLLYMRISSTKHGIIVTRPMATPQVSSDRAKSS